VKLTLLRFICVAWRHRTDSIRNKIHTKSEETK
jgi:hypothetical protein